VSRIPFTLASIRAARRINAGERPAAEAAEIKPASLARIADLYANVPDALLARMERLLVEREQLKQMISTLLGRVA
jgi:hypothetical protein